MKLPSRRSAAAILALVSAGAFAAALLVVLKPFSIDPPQVRFARAYGYVAAGAVLGSVAIIASAALFTHPALLKVAIFLGLGLLVGSYSSENSYALLPTLAVVLLVIAYVRLRQGASKVRWRPIVIMGTSAALGVVALVALKERPRIVQWDRTRDAGRVEVSVTASEGECGSLGSHQMISSTRDAGCDEYLPHGDARVSISTAIASALAGIAGGVAARREM